MTTYKEDESIFCPECNEYFEIDYDHGECDSEGIFYVVCENEKCGMTFKIEVVYYEKYETFKIDKGEKMAAYNFRKEFVEKIKTGEKCQTIRKKRKNQCKAGDTLQLYFGMRTKYCEKIIEDVMCKSVFDIKIGNKNIRIGWKLLSEREIQEFIKADGFESSDDFFTFFEVNYGNIFDGVLIKW